MIDCSFLKIRDARLLGRCDRGSFCARSPWRGDQVAIPNDDFMDHSLYAVSLGRELALFDRPLDEDVVPFLKARRNAGKVAVER